MFCGRDPRVLRPRIRFLWWVGGDSALDWVKISSIDAIPACAMPQVLLGSRWEGPLDLRLWSGLGGISGDGALPGLQGTA